MVQHDPAPTASANALRLNAIKAVSKSRISAGEASLYCLPRRDEAWSLANVSSARTNYDHAASSPTAVANRVLQGIDAFVLDGVLTADECDHVIATAEASERFSFWNSEHVSGEQEESVERSFRNADTIEMDNPALAEELWQRIAPHLEAHGAAVVRVESESEQQRWERDAEGVWDACGTNADLLVSRYLSGGHFSPHTDGCSVMDLNYRSMYSMIVYLNDCLPNSGDGGTRFYDDAVKGKFREEEWEDRACDGDKDGAAKTRGVNTRFTADRSMEQCCVAARRGRALVFYHNIVHEGTPPSAEGLNNGGRMVSDREQGRVFIPMGRKYIIRSDVMYQRRNPICTLPQDKEAYELYRQAVELAGQAGSEAKALEMFKHAFSMSRNLKDIYGM